MTTPRLQSQEPLRIRLAGGGSSVRVMAQEPYHVSLQNNGVRSVAAYLGVGPQGPAGPAGAPGATGPAGADGAQGPAGAPGPTGPAGEDGAGIDFSGRATTYATLPDDLGPEDAGQGYLVDADGLLYIWSGTSFPADGDGVAFRGPQGPQGPTGATGPAGPTGASGATGATGATGPQGPIGLQGAQGIQGEQGDPGVDGTLRNAWQGPWADQSYADGDAVSHGGSSWLAIGEATGEPGVDSAWTPLAEKGEQGTPGLGTVASIVAGTNVTVDDTDPANPIISATGGSGSGDMEASVYDPTNVAADVFDAGNLATGTVDPDRLGSSAAGAGALFLADDSIWRPPTVDPDQLFSSDLPSVLPVGSVPIVTGDSTWLTTTLATVATTGDYDDLTDKPTLGTAAAQDTTAFATAAQGALADSAVQDLGDLGVTATASEINVVDGLTASTTELNYVDGVTSAIQTQINAKAPTASPTFTGTPVVPNAVIGEEVAVASGTSGTVTLNLNTARIFTLAPTGNVTTLTISNWPAGEAATVTLVVDQGATARSIATPSGGKFLGAATPTQANNKDCIFTYFSADGGTTIYCAASQEV